jgi:formate dehydrogenase
MTNIICVVYDHPVSGYPPSYARASVPTIEQYHGGPPEDIDFAPGELLGCVSGELGLREFVEGRGHNLIVTSDKQGPDSVLDRELRESGTPSPLRRIIPGGACPTTA